MARKKKEESKLELATPETVADTAPVEQTAPIAVEEKRTKKKSVTPKKTATKTTKTATPKTKAKTEEQEKRETKQEVVT